MVFLSRIVTKSGDDGLTSLEGTTRVAKDSQIIAAIGQIDELNASIGVVLAHADMPVNAKPGPFESDLIDIQHDLFDIGADLCVPYVETAKDKLRLTEDHIIRLEETIAHYNTKLEPVTSFVLPGGSKVAAFLHLARTICRRAERAIIGMKSKNYMHKVNPAIPVYMNRLSDLLFVMSRVRNQDGKRDVLWEPGRNQDRTKP